MGRKKGVPLAPEQIEKLRIAALARWAKPEEKQKQSERQKGNQNRLGFRKGVE
jgi:hypothetical protein